MEGTGLVFVVSRRRSASILCFGTLRAKNVVRECNRVILPRVVGSSGDGTGSMGMDWRVRVWGLGGNMGVSPNTHLVSPTTLGQNELTLLCLYMDTRGPQTTV